MIKQRKTPNESPADDGKYVKVYEPINNGWNEYKNYVSPCLITRSRVLRLSALVLAVGALVAVYHAGFHAGRETSSISQLRGGVEAGAAPWTDDKSKNNHKSAFADALRVCKIDIDVNAPLPPDIDGARTSEIWEYLECSDYFEKAIRPTNHKPVWDCMRAVYSALMKPKPYITSRLQNEETAMQVPYSVRKVEGKGLGLFAEANIKKGTVIDDSNVGGRIEFKRGDDFRRYINALPAPDMACLVLQCSAIESTTDNTDPKKGAVIAVDLDDSCFANTGGRNANVVYTGKDACTTCDYSARDIEAGEEMIWSYGEYVHSHGWKWFSL